MAAAKCLLDERFPTRSGARVEAVVWEVPRTAAFPEGIRMRFVYVRRTSGKRILTYRIDNEHGKGIHEHDHDVERPLAEKTWQAAYRKFDRRWKALESEATG